MPRGPAPDPARVAALFDAVVDLDPEAARRHLDAACDGDPALRDAVERLVAQDRAADPGFLAPPSALISEVLREQRPLPDGARTRGVRRSGGDGDSLSGRSGDRQSPDAGDEPRVAGRIGRFTLVRRLGEGAMGVVYMGYDEVLDRRVALKLLRPSVAGGAWLLREGRALGRLAHPNVVAVHEAGRHDGHVVLAMEFIEGPTLRAWLAERPRRFREVLRMFLAVGRGLAAVHAAGLVHRDFKPENVLVGKDGRPRVADFGLAALASGPTPPGAQGAAAGTGEGSALDVSLPPAGGLLGTPGYLSPERFSGEPATPASDQWSFCVALYHAVYGTFPFPLEGTLVDLARRVLGDTPAIPPHGPEVPAWLGPVVLRGLTRDPSARFPSMEALLAAIERHLPRDPELDRSVVRGELLRHRIGRLLVVTALLVGVLWRGLHHSLTPGRLVLVNLGMMGMVTAVVALRWRRLSRNRYGRRAAALFAGGLVAVLLHRVAGMCLGAPVQHILVGDLLVLGTLFGTAAVAIERWLGWLAATAIAGALVSALVPSFVWGAFTVATLLNLMILTADAFRAH